MSKVIMQLLWSWFKLALKWRVITLSLRNKKAIGVGLNHQLILTSETKCGVGFGLCHLILFSKINRSVIDFLFASHCFVKTSNLLHKFHWFMVG